MLGGNIERIKSLDMDASVKLEVFENIVILSDITFLIQI